MAVVAGSAAQPLVCMHSGACMNAAAHEAGGMNHVDATVWELVGGHARHARQHFVSIFPRHSSTSARACMHLFVVVQLQPSTDCTPLQAASCINEAAEQRTDIHLCTQLVNGTASMGYHHGRSHGGGRASIAVIW